MLHLEVSLLSHTSLFSKVVQVHLACWPSTLATICLRCHHRPLSLREFLLVSCHQAPARLLMWHLLVCLGATLVCFQLLVTIPGKPLLSTICLNCLVHKLLPSNTNINSSSCCCNNFCQGSFENFMEYSACLYLSLFFTPAFLILLECRIWTPLSLFFHQVVLYLMVAAVEAAHHPLAIIVVQVVTFQEALLPLIIKV